MPPTSRPSWKELNLTAEEFLGQVGLKIPAGEKDRMLIEQIPTRPTCDVNGIIGGYTGEGAKTVIAGEARAKVSFRLVGEQDPKHISEALRSVRAGAASRTIARSRSSATRARARSSFPTTMPALKKAQGSVVAGVGHGRR